MYKLSVEGSGLPHTEVYPHTMGKGDNPVPTKTKLEAGVNSGLHDGIGRVGMSQTLQQTMLKDPTSVVEGRSENSVLEGS